MSDFKTTFMEARDSAAKEFDGEAIRSCRKARGLASTDSERLAVYRLEVSLYDRGNTTALLTSAIRWIVLVASLVGSWATLLFTEGDAAAPRQPWLSNEWPLMVALAAGMAVSGLVTFVLLGLVVDISEAIHAMRAGQSVARLEAMGVSAWDASSAG